MADPFLHPGAQILCTHGAQVNTVSSTSRVFVGGDPVATLSDTFTVAGCPFQIPIGTGTKPQPCVKVQWLVPAFRVRVEGKPALIRTSTGLCQSAEQIPQGSPTVVATQIRAKGT